MDEAWWMPMVHVPDECIDGKPFFRSLVTERGLPRSILVNAQGSRFTNEALPYNDLVKAIKRRDPAGATPNSPAWLIFDEGFRSGYSLATIRPDRAVPSWVVQAPGLAGLASSLGMPPTGLTRAVEEWNQMCASGRDQRFNRGETLYQRYYGDPEAEHPNLGPIDRSPFYAVSVLAGTIGTKGGPRVDSDARVLRSGGDPIPGLYAVGTVAAGWVGAGYPGPGTPLSVGMTFAYRAARDAVGAGDA
jgi:succinate dehydrogenase/fumarate reductase flavoprotein subunit